MSARPGGNQTVSSLTLGKVTMSIREWSAETGLSVSCLRQRKAAGWTDEAALTMPRGGARVHRPEFCRGCRYQGAASGIPCCDYLLITGRPRTVYRGIKTDLCPRKLQAAGAGQKG